MGRNTTTRIGLVLNSVPGYSETFFFTKINQLAKGGAEITLFARGKENPDLLCKHTRPFPVFQHPLWRTFLVLLIVPVVFLSSPQAAIRFWKLEKEEGQRTKEILRSMYLNAHMLTKRLDWLHFGFATTAIGRENVAWAIGAKMAVSFRGYDINEFPFKNPGCYTKLWKRVNQVHSISEYLLQRAYDLGLPQFKPSHIITPALAAPLYPKTDFEPHNPVRILTVARLTPIKGLMYGIEAMAKLKAEGLHVRYTLVGDGLEYNKLVTQAESLGLKENVIFTGVLSHGDTVMLMRECDVYVQPSLNEGFCNAVLEAQAIGCLCIATDVGALSENIVRNETGWLVPPRNSHALASAIIKTIRLLEVEKKRISDRARERVKTLFTVETHLQSWKKFYQA